MRVDDAFYGNRISPIYLEEACGDLEERAAICAMWAGWMKGQGQVRVTSGMSALALRLLSSA